MTFLAHAAELVLIVAFYGGLAYLVRDFFHSPPNPRKAEDGYAVMPASEREWPIPTTNKTGRSR